MNSGRATKEHNIEDTALQTNLEASEEIARQLRLRDLAGLIVIDFIDMMENRSNRSVERKLKDCLKNDRARIQVGRISHFGLMEMSRQRIRQGVIESSTHKCPVCAGTGLVRSTESIALLVMRAVEDHVLRKPGQSINVKVPTDAALYILNNKRNTLNALEAKHGLTITLLADDHIPGAHFQIERGEARVSTGDVPAMTHVRVDSAAMDELDVADAAIEDEDEEEEEAPEEPRAEGESDGEGEGRRRGRRRRGRGRDRDREARPEAVREPVQALVGNGESDDEGEDAADETNVVASDGTGEDSDEPRRRRRRGRRGGRRNRRENGEGDEAPVQGDATSAGEADTVVPLVADVVLAQDAIASDADATPEAVSEGTAEPVAEESRPRRRRSRRGSASTAEVEASPPTNEEALESAAALSAAGTPMAEPTEQPAAAELAGGPEADVEPAPETPAKPKRELPEGIVVSSSQPQADGETPKPKKAGWWQRVLR